MQKTYSISILMRQDFPDGFVFLHIWVICNLNNLDCFVRRGLIYVPNCFQSPLSFLFTHYNKSSGNLSFDLRVMIGSDLDFVVAYNRYQLTVKVSHSCFRSDFACRMLGNCNFSFEFTLILYLMFKFVNSFELALLHG